VLCVVGSVAVVAGAATMLFGASIVPDRGHVTPSVDSEMRFYGVWYAAAGVLLLRTVRTVETAGTTVRAVAACFFLAGCSRVISLVVLGRPHVTQLALMALELALPPLIVLWQSRVSREAPTTG